MADALFRAPTTTGQASGRDSTTGLSWAFESPDQHWREHGARQLRYWLSRSPEERLAQAAAYRTHVHGDIVAPTEWHGRFLAPGEE